MLISAFSDDCLSRAVIYPRKNHPHDIQELIKDDPPPGQHMIFTGETVTYKMKENTLGVHNQEHWVKKMEFS